jgi:uncharacterized protein YjbJ (UPF0337 family)
MASGTQRKWEGRWDQLKGRVQKLWGDLTDDDLQRAKGDFNRLVGVIKEKTGKTEEEIERMLDEAEDDED